MARLSDTQTTLLSAAAARKNGSLLPPPETLNVTGKALDRTLEALIRRGFVEEVQARDETGTWRRDDKGVRLALVITAAGLAAIGVEANDEAEATAPTAAQQTTAEAAPTARPGGKLGAILAAVTTENGATLDELTEAACWQKHTTRAALTRLRQRGFDIRLQTTGDRKAYRLHTTE